MDIGPRRRRKSVPGGLDVASLPHTLPSPTPLYSTGLRLRTYLVSVQKRMFSQDAVIPAFAGMTA